MQLTSTDAWAEIQVVDTGQGIAAEFLPHVLSAPRRPTPTTRRQGRCLGLAIVRFSSIPELAGAKVAAGVRCVRP
jgi:signal transduction histidine kinase